MKKGFTLAEVLITLGIIGVVAALTLPTLLQNHKRQVYSTQLKKTYNTVSNAFRLSVAENGDMNSWAIPTLGNINQGIITHKEFFDTYVKPYIKYNNIKYGSDIKVYLNDGSTILFHPGAVYDIIMDINGDKKPNAGGRDVYSAYIVNNSISNFRQVSRDVAKEKCKQYAGTRDMDGYCFLILKYDNFEFKDDYPIKL